MINKQNNQKGNNDMGTLIKDLSKLKEKFRKKYIGDLPKNNLEKEIFAELDLMDSNLYGQLTNRKEYLTFDLRYAKECIKRIKNYIKQREKEKFMKNEILFEWYKLCLEAIKLMGDYNKHAK